MANVFEDFLRGNIKEVVIGLAVGVIIAVLGDFTLSEGLTLLILSPLVALLLNQLFQTFIPNEKNQRTASIILVLIALFFIAQQFQIGFFSVENINIPIEEQSIAKPSVNLIKNMLGAGKTGIFATLGGLSGLAFFINPIFGIVVLALFILLFAIPLIGFSIAIFQNFQLILIIFGLVALAFLVFRTKQIKSLSSR